MGNFPSTRTVRVVYHLPKISGLSRRARLDSSYNMKLVRNSRNLLFVNEFPLGTSQSGKRDYLFRISVCPGKFPVGRTKKNVYHLHPDRNFREFVVNGKQPKAVDLL